MKSNTGRRILLSCLFWTSLACLEFDVVQVQIQRGEIMANGEKHKKGKKNSLPPLSTEKPKK